MSSLEEREMNVMFNLPFGFVFLLLDLFVFCCNSFGILAHGIVMYTFRVYDPVSINLIQKKICTIVARELFPCDSKSYKIDNND